MNSGAQTGYLARQHWQDPPNNTQIGYTQSIALDSKNRQQLEKHTDGGVALCKPILQVSSCVQHTEKQVIGPESCDTWRVSDNQLSTRNNALQQRLTDAEHAVEQLQARLDAQVSENEQLRAQIATAAQEMQLYEKIGYLHADSAQLPDTAGIQEEKQLLAEKLRNFQLENDSLRQLARDSAENARRALEQQQEVKSQQSIISAQRSALTALEAQNSQLLVQIQKQDEQAATSAQQRISELEAAIKALSRENELLTQSQLCKQLSERNSALEAAIRKAEDAEHQCQSARQEISVLVERIRTLESSGIAELQQTNRDLQMELESSRELLDCTKIVAADGHTQDQFQRYEKLIKELQRRHAMQLEQQRQRVQELQVANTELQHETQRQRHIQTSMAAAIAELKRRLAVRQIVTESYQAMQARLHESSVAEKQLESRLKKQKLEISVVQAREAAFLSKSERLLQDIHGFQYRSKQRTGAQLAGDGLQ